MDAKILKNKEVNIGKKTILGIDNRTTKMERSLFGMSNARSGYEYMKAIGNKSGMRSQIGKLGGHTAAFNSTKKGC